MKIIAVEIARVIQLFNADEIKPTKGAYVPEFLQQIQEHYGFTVVPDQKRGFEGGIKFTGGRFVTDEHKTNIRDLIIYNDGIAIETHHTDDAGIVVDEFIVWMKEFLEINDPVTKIPRSYVSGLVVDFDQPIDHVLTVYKSFSQQISKCLKDIYDLDYHFNLYRIALSTDEKLTPALMNPDFVIERRLGYPHSKNRYFCGAPLPTDVHINLMEQFERAVIQAI